jgi:cellulose synthase/poly-beta-1,6-N-acetylglucosamine synthase-like glycosyltransferase
MVQTRWEHINRNYSLLTKIQSIFLDAHFILEHTARNSSGRFFNFNGTAGVWRKACILSSGGWQHETLTEDLDLSYRAQLRGWRFVFAPQIVTPGEIPVDVKSFKSQQHRWAKGGIETALKLLPAILKSSYPLKVKIESVFHLTGNMNYLFMLLLALLAYPALVIRIEMGWRSLFIFDLICFLGSVLPICLYYLISQREVTAHYFHKILYLPLLMAMGIGLSINNGKAVLEALCGYKSSFIRTPKFQIENKSDTWKHKKYRTGNTNIQIVIELMFGIYFLSAIGFALKFSVYSAIPFLVLFCSGFLYVSLLSIYETIITRRHQAALSGAKTLKLQ